MNISLRTATIDDLEILEYWDQQQHVIASDPDDDWNWAEELLNDPEWREQLIAELDGRPIGMVQIIDPQLEETHYWGAVGPNKRAIDIWIGNGEDLGKGYGTVMMQLALARCFRDTAVTEVLIDPLVSNVRAIKFYERLGFEFVEHRKLNISDCAVYRYPRSTWMKVGIR